MKNYLELLEDVYNNGIEKPDRTGIGSKSIVGAQLKFDLSKCFPLLNSRRVFPRIPFEELIFMLNGKSQTKELEKHNINIWKGNTSKKFQRSVNLEHLKEGDFGKMYGVQLRNFNGFDQLNYIIDELRNNKFSRRIITTHYNPPEAKFGVLFPCHIMTQFIVTDEDILNCVFWIRSSDIPFGAWANIAYYAFFTHLLAKMFNFKVGTLVYQAGDAHIYKNQFELVKELIDRAKTNEWKTCSPPQIKLKKDINSINDLLLYTWKDVEIKRYNPLPAIQVPPMAI